MIKNILITGMPRSGKTTLLKSIISNIENKVGFVTNEICENGERVGFEIETSRGEKSVLAHINFKTDSQVSKYFVDVRNLEMILLNIPPLNKETILYIDEIAPMELFSEKFRQFVLNYLNSQNICIASIYKSLNEFCDEIKKRGDVIIIEITEENRESKKIFIEDLLEKIKNK